MMLVDLEARGIRLSAHCERLLVDAPTGALTPELRAYLAVHKSKLLDELRQTQVPSEPIQPPGTTSCTNCCESALSLESNPEYLERL